MLTEIVLHLPNRRTLYIKGGNLVIIEGPCFKFLKKRPPKWKYQRQMRNHFKSLIVG